MFDGVYHLLLVIENDVAPVTIFVNPETGLISKLETIENDHWLRDVMLKVFYDRWEITESGLAFPLGVSIFLEGVLIHEETSETIEVNVPLNSGVLELAGNVSQDFDTQLSSSQGETRRV